MPDGRGYRRFDTFPLLEGRSFDITIDDYTIQGATSSWSWNRAPSILSLRTHGGTSIEQLLFRGPDMPLNMEPFSASFQILVRFEEDIRRLMMAASLGLPVQANFNIPIVDQWSIKAAGTGAVNWRTSRKTIFDNVTFTHSTHPPKAYIDGTVQTIVTTAPSAGEVQVPLTQTPDFEFEVIVTPALSTGNFLRFFYWPSLLIKFVGETHQVQLSNAWVFGASFLDYPAGDYTLP